MNFNLPGLIEALTSEDASISVTSGGRMGGVSGWMTSAGRHLWLSDSTADLALRASKLWDRCILETGHLQTEA